MTDAAVLQQYGMPQDLANEILSYMNNVRPNDIGAVISFDGNGNISKIVMSSNNIIGKTSDKWIYVWILFLMLVCIIRLDGMFTQNFQWMVI